jgi:5-methylcytosine-specific restriction endonuclease McrA
MKKHTSEYMNHFGYTIADVILCEVCGCVANSIHHVIPRSKFGSKRKDEQDRWENLIALCNFHHDMVHNRDVSLNEKIKEIVANRK